MTSVSDFYKKFTLKQNPEILSWAKDQSRRIQSPDGDLPLRNRTSSFRTRASHLSYKNFQPVTIDKNFQPVTIDKNFQPVTIAIIFLYLKKTGA